MNINFKIGKLKKDCHDDKRACKHWGATMANLLRRRLDDLAAAESLEIMRKLPQTRCHELHGDRAGQLSVDLLHPYRLIFCPCHNPLPKKEDGGLDWTNVTAITIIEVVDTHD